MLHLMTPVSGPEFGIFKLDHQQLLLVPDVWLTADDHDVGASPAANIRSESRCTDGFAN